MLLPTDPKPLGKYHRQPPPPSLSSPNTPTHLDECECLLGCCSAGCLLGLCRLLSSSRVSRRLHRGQGLGQQLGRSLGTVRLQRWGGGGGPVGGGGGLVSGCQGVGATAAGVCSWVLRWLQKSGCIPCLHAQVAAVALSKSRLDCLLALLHYCAC
jgi:hypothetical protein